VTGLKRVAGERETGERVPKRKLKRQRGGGAQPPLRIKKPRKRRDKGKPTVTCRGVSGAVWDGGEKKPGKAKAKERKRVLTQFTPAD